VIAFSGAALAVALIRQKDFVDASEETLEELGDGTLAAAAR